MRPLLLPALLALAASAAAGGACAQTSLADVDKPHHRSSGSGEPSGSSGFATIKPLTPAKPFGSEPFKPYTPPRPFEGQHIGSNRGGLDPYPHAKSARHHSSTYGLTAAEREGDPD